MLRNWPSICVLRPWFDRHSVRRSNPTEASACGGRERTCRTSSNPNFQQSLLAIIYASFSFLFQGEGSGSFLLLTVSSWQHTHSKPEYYFSKENIVVSSWQHTHTLSPNIISPKRTCSVRWDGWDGSIERERILFITALSFVTCTSPRNYKNVNYAHTSGGMSANDTTFLRQRDAARDGQVMMSQTQRLKL